MDIYNEYSFIRIDMVITSSCFIGFFCDFCHYRPSTVRRSHGVSPSIPSSTDCATFGAFKLPVRTAASLMVKSLCALSEITATYFQFRTPHFRNKHYLNTSPKFGLWNTSSLTRNSRRASFSHKRLFLELRTHSWLIVA